MPSEISHIDPSAISKSRIENSFRVSIVLFLLALIPRIVCISYFESASKDDCYWTLSHSLRNEYDFVVRPAVPQTEFDRNKCFYFDDVPTGHRLPATPISLAILGWISGDSEIFVKVFQAILTSLVSVLAYLSLRNLGNAESGILAGAIWAFWPYSLFYGHYVAFMSEPLAVFTIAILIFISTIKSPNWKVACFTGVVLGICVLNRGESLLFAGAYLTLLFVLKQEWRRFILTVSTIVALMIFPWIYRNYRVFGTPVMNTLSGYALWLGNNPWTLGTYCVQDALDDPQILYVSERFPDIWNVNEATRSDYFKQATKQYLIETASSNPIRLVSLYGMKALYFYIMPKYLETRGGAGLNLKGQFIEFGTVIYLTIFKTAFLYLLFKKRPNANEVLLVFPFAFIFAISVLVFPTLRYEYSYDIGMILFVAFRLPLALKQGLFRSK